MVSDAGDAVPEAAGTAAAAAAAVQADQDAVVESNGLAQQDSESSRDSITVLWCKTVIKKEKDSDLPADPPADPKHDDPDPATPKQCNGGDASHDRSDATQVLGEHNYRAKLRSSTEAALAVLPKREVESEPSQSSEEEEEEVVRQVVEVRQLTVMKQEVPGEDEEVDVEHADDEKENLAKPAAAARPGLPGAPGNGVRQCLICWNLFDGLEPFRAHMLATHMHPRPYTCMLCWKSFFTASEITRHTDHNCKEVLYKCQRCDRVWSSDSHHAACVSCGDKPVEPAHTPYECATCGQAFTLLRHLSAHLKTHGSAASDAFKCQRCSALFSTSIALMIHVKHHSPSKECSPSRSSRGRSRATPGRPGRSRVEQEDSEDELTDTETEDGDESDGLGAALDEELARVRDAASPQRPRVPLPAGKPVVRGGQMLFRCHWCPREFRFNHLVNLHMRSHLTVQDSQANKRKWLKRERIKAIQAFFAKQNGQAGRGLGSGLRGRGLGGGLHGRGRGSGLPVRGLSNGLRGRGLSIGLHGRGLSSGLHGRGLSIGLHGRGLSSGLNGRGLNSGLHGRGLHSGLHGKALGSGVNGRGLSSGLNGRGLGTGLHGRGLGSGLNGRGLIHVKRIGLLTRGAGRGRSFDSNCSSVREDSPKTPSSPKRLGYASF